MQLVDKYGLNLDDPINDHLPFQVKNPHFPDVPVTIRQLMTHTSSISDNHYYDIYHQVLVKGDSPIAQEQFMRDMFAVGGRFYSKASWHKKKPGTLFDYSNMGATLAAVLSAAVEDKHRNSSDPLTMPQMSRKFVMEPLGVTDASYRFRDLQHEGQAPIAVPSYWTRNKGFYSYCLFGYPDVADGLWHSSATNYARFFSSFINNGTYKGVRLLSNATVAEMRKIQPGPGAEQKQALIWYYREQEGRLLLGHNGGDDGIATEAFFNPKTNVGFVVFCNGDWDIDGLSTAFTNIENKLLSVFDPNGQVPGIPSGQVSFIDRKIRSRKRSRQASKFNAAGAAGAAAGVSSANAGLQWTNSTMRSPSPEYTCICNIPDC
jgi:CubicO group peptidase (beta-lactamase class C family)